MFLTVAKCYTGHRAACTMVLLAFVHQVEQEPYFCN